MKYQDHINICTVFKTVTQALYELLGKLRLHIRTIGNKKKLSLVNQSFYVEIMYLSAATELLKYCFQSSMFLAYS